ncbi:KilA-N domain-containing protein [Mammaliicoccus fleurettii]|uniref:KilA-N domain-containing protein n=1 Tax=Mammaliicoccus fleurettii TaxID=150056 RepID=UPI002DBBAEB1|nr:KilA-N domain-containing protein [Mammaliicoccus fleurettii]MEB8067472.1 KilA-N domain-containing protein [Mammaliicoccus fleurettii]
MDKIKANGQEISIFNSDNDDFISLTDIAKYKDSENPRFLIQNWLRSRSTIEFLGVWEDINNSDFNRVEFEAVKNQAGSNSFVLTPTKWIETTRAVGITSKAGRYGGTYAHKDIAFEFASWISPEFKLYIIQDYQRLKEQENDPERLNWDIKRLISKSNYTIHTDAIKENLINSELTKQQIGITYATEADLLNVALFGMTAKEWKQNNPNKSGNQRDHATIQELIVLNNLQSRNAELISDGYSQKERLLKLNELARNQMKSLLQSRTLKNASNQNFLK